MFVITVEFEISPQHVQAFLAAMNKNAADSLALEQGCLQFDVCVNVEREDRVFLYEVYVSSEDFEAHLKSEHFLTFNQKVTPWVINKTINSWTQVS